MRARRADAEVLLPRDAAHVATQLHELAHDVGGRPADGRRDLEHRLHQLGVDLRLQLVPFDGGEHRVDVLHEVERRRVEQLVLLLDAERVRLAAPKRWSSTLARLSPARSRRPMMSAGTTCLLMQHRVGLDLDLPARVEQRRDDAGRRRPHLPEDLAMRAGDLGPVRRVGDEHPCADDVLRATARPAPAPRR